MNQSTNNNQGERIEPLGPVNAAIERNTHWITLGLLAVLACAYSPTARHIVLTAAELAVWAVVVVVVMLLIDSVKQALV